MEFEVSFTWDNYWVFSYKMNPVSILVPSFLKSQVNIISSYVYVSLVSCLFCYQNTVLYTHTILIHIPCPWISHPKNVWWWIQTRTSSLCNFLKPSVTSLLGQVISLSSSQTLLFHFLHLEWDTKIQDTEQQTQLGDILFFIYIAERE